MAKITSVGYLPVNKSGDTMTGSLTLAGPPVNDLEAATKKYVDDHSIGLEWTYINKFTAANVPTLDITGLVGYNQIQIFVKEFLPQNDNSDMLMVASNDGGTTWLTDYSYGAHYNAANYYQVTSSSIIVPGHYAIGISNDPNFGGVTAKIEFWNMGSPTRYARCFIQGVMSDPYYTYSMTASATSAGCVKDLSTINALRFACDTGNIISAEILAYGRNLP